MKFVFLFALLIAMRLGYAQNRTELPFIEHLINKGYFKEVIYLINNDSLDYNKEKLDSLNFFEGWANYSIKNLEQSTSAFLKVDKESPFYLKSRFFAGYNQMFQGKYTEAWNTLSNLDLKTEPNSSLLNFELSGIKMLEGNWPEAKAQLKKVNPEIATINQQVAALGQIIKEHEHHRYKSPLLAGVMSGIVPGSGKIYAGKTGEGIAVMIASAGFGLITWENYRKAGLSNFKTILFGSIFAANYVSNIYGSVISVRIKNDEYQNAVHNQILFQLHIPLRNFFE